MIATEESHGILATPRSARQGLRRAPRCCSPRLALDQKRQGRTLVDYLDDLNRQFGYFRNEVLNIVMTGLEGKQNMARMLDALRRSPPQEIGGLPVTGFEDLRDEDGRMGPFKGDTDKAARNFLIFRLGGRRTRGEGLPAAQRHGAEGEGVHRGCGSEPMKAGTPASAWSSLCAEVDRLAQALANDFLKLAMAR